MEFYNTLEELKQRQDFQVQESFQNSLYALCDGDYREYLMLKSTILKNLCPYSQVVDRFKRGDTGNRQYDAWLLKLLLEKKIDCQALLEIFSTERGQDLAKYLSIKDKYFATYAYDYIEGCLTHDIHKGVSCGAVQFIMTYLDRAAKEAPDKANKHRITSEFRLLMRLSRKAHTVKLAFMDVCSVKS